MKIKEFIFDVWLAFGVLGMAIGLFAPIAGIFYALWGALS
jgi:hypothetical protein